MNWLILIISLMIVPPFASAQTEKWEGFKFATELNLPFQDFIENAIIGLESVGDIEGTNTEPYQLVEVAKVKKVTNAQKLETDKIAFQIETCRKQNLQLCPVQKETRFQTAFVLEGRKLTTCRHSFHNWLVWAAKANNIPIEQLSPPIILYSRGGAKVLYNSATSKKDNLLKMTFLNKDSKLLYITNTALQFPSQNLVNNLKISDIVQMETAKKIVPSYSLPVRSSVETVNINEEAYLIGYPAQVKGYDDESIDGWDLRVSHGFVIRDVPERAGVELSNFAYFGMSGGPVISPQGEILGMSCNVTNMKTAAQNPSNTHGIAILLDHSYLEDVWKKLVYEDIPQQP